MKFSTVNASHASQRRLAYFDSDGLLLGDRMDYVEQRLQHENIIREGLFRHFV